MTPELVDVPGDWRERLSDGQSIEDILAVLDPNVILLDDAAEEIDWIEVVPVRTLERTAADCRREDQAWERRWQRRRPAPFAQLRREVVASAAGVRVAVRRPRARCGTRRRTTARRRARASIRSTSADDPAPVAPARRPIGGAP